MTERTTWTDERLDDVVVHITARFDQIDARFVQVDARFDRLERRMDRFGDELREVRRELARLHRTLTTASLGITGVLIAQVVAMLVVLA